MSGLDILIVEDEVPLAKLYRAVASADGHSVTLVVTGFEALEKIQRRRFDLVLLDINLGSGPDGFDVLHTIRDLNRGERVVMITARGSPHDIETGLIALRADNYLVKPMGESMFRIRLRAEVRQVRKIAPTTTFINGPLTVRIENETCSLNIGDHIKLLPPKDGAVLCKLLSAPSVIHTPEMLAPVILGISEARPITLSEKEQMHMVITRMRSRIDRFIERSQVSLPNRNQAQLSAIDIIESVYGKGWRCNLATADS